MWTVASVTMSGRGLFSRWMADGWRFLAAWLLIGFASPVQAVGLPVERAAWFDASARLPFEQVRRQDFKPVPEVSVGGYSQGVSWWRVTVPALSGTDRLWVMIQPSYLDDVQVYDPDLQGGWRQRQQGDRFAFGAKESRELVTAFDLDPPSGRPLVFYVRVQTSSLHAIVISVLPEPEFRDRMECMSLGFGAYAGVTVLLLLLSLWHFGLRRELLWLVNALLQLSTLGLALGHFGYLSKYGLPDWTQGIDRLTTVLMCAHNFVAALYYALLAQRLQARRAWQVLLTLPLWALPIQLGLLACGQTTPALQLNFVSALCGSVLGLVSVFFFRIEDASLRRSICGLYFFQAAYLLFFLLPLLGVLPATEWHLYPALLVNLVTALTQHVVLGRHDAWREAQLLRYQAQAVQEREALASQQLRLQESARLIGMLLHEIKNPLALIRLALHNLTYGLAFNAQASGSLQRAQQAVDDIDGVLEHCQQADRLDSGALAEANAPVDLSLALVEQLDRHPVRVRVRLDLPDQPLWVRADASALAVVLRNLLDNALHYSVAGTLVDVELAVWAPSGADRMCLLRIGNQVLMTDLPDADQLFNRYYRGARSHRRTGSGLGLFLVKELLKQAGGSIAYRAQAERVEFEAMWPLEGHGDAPLG